MKKVKCVNNKECPTILTIGKIYDVLEYIPMSYNFIDVVYIINDLGRKNSFYINQILSDGTKNYIGESIFIEATHEYRNEIINEILK